jgi:hypothetical protein
LLDKNLLKKVHDFLLESPVQIHSFAIKFISTIMNLAAKNGEINVKKVCDLFSSPYEYFQIALCEGL